jgi:hypothetical protein
MMAGIHTSIALLGEGHLLDERKVHPRVTDERPRRPTLCNYSDYSFRLERAAMENPSQVPRVCERV